MYKVMKNQKSEFASGVRCLHNRVNSGSNISAVLKGTRAPCCPDFAALELEGLDARIS